MGGFTTPPAGTPIQTYTISNNILIAHDKEIYISNTSGIFKEITIAKVYPSPVTMRTYFEMNAGPSTNTLTCQIYKNGSAYGTARTSNTNGYIAYTEDLSFASGDKIQLYASFTYPAGAYIKNFRILGDVSNITFLAFITI